MKYAFLFLIPFLFTLGGCEKKDIDPQQAVLAEVNGEGITVEELRALMPEEGPEEGENNDPDALKNNEKTTMAEIEALKRGLLDQLIDRKMLLQEARRLNIVLGPSEIKNQVDQLLDGVDEPTFFKRLSDQNISRESWEKATHENLLIEKLLDQLAREGDAKALNISEKTVQDYYDKNPEQWHVDEQLKLRQIVVDSAEKARTLRATILNGGHFSEIAKIHSMQTHTEDGDGLGYVSREEVPDEFAPLFELDIGSVSEVIKTAFGYHLVLIEDKRPAQILPFEEIREKLYQQLLDKKRELAFSKWIEKLRSRTEVRINEELLKSFS